MTPPDSTDWYDNHVREAAERYEALAFPDVHNSLLALLPAAEGALALDVGAGSGRDAAWLAEQGFEVVAVEPSRAMRGRHQAVLRRAREPLRQRVLSASRAYCG